MTTKNGHIHTQPTAVTLRDGMIWITLQDKRIIAAPLNWFPWLATASAQEQATFELHPLSIYWPDLDDGIDIAALLMGNWTTPMGENETEAEPN